MKQKFTQWTQLMCCPTLSPNEKVVIGNILRIANIGTWEYISHDYLVKVSKVSLSTLKRILKGLEKRDFIVTVIVPKKNSREHFNNYIPQIETITSAINQRVNLDYCSFSGFECAEDGKYFEINTIQSGEISMGQNEPLIINKKISCNNNNYNNSICRYMEPINENSKSNVKSNMDNNQNDVNLTKGQLGFLKKEEWDLDGLLSTIPTPTEGKAELSTTLRYEDDWEYRTEEHTCFQQTFDEATRNRTIYPMDEARKIANGIYKDWETKNRKFNERMLNSIIALFEKYWDADAKDEDGNREHIHLRPKNKKNVVLSMPTRHSDRITTSEIDNYSTSQISKNPDILNRLVLASQQIIPFANAVVKTIEFLCTYRRVTPSICRVYFNALELLQTDNTISDEKRMFACDMLDKLEKAINDCEGRSMFNRIMIDEYSRLFETEGIPKLQTAPTQDATSGMSETDQRMYDICQRVMTDWGVDYKTYRSVISNAQMNGGYCPVVSKMIDDTLGFINKRLVLAS